MDKKTTQVMEAKMAAKGQERPLKKYRDLYLKKREMETQISEFKTALAKLEEELDFRDCMEEVDGKATGRLRLPDGSFQLTKTIVTKESLLTAEVEADSRLYGKLMEAGFIVMVPVIQTKQILENEGARKLAKKYITSEEVTKITATISPK